MEEADKLAKRYALWTVRRKFAWGRYPADDAASTRRIDQDIVSGIYELDVVLRLEVEDVIGSGRQDSSRAGHLRSLIEACAGRMAAALGVRATAEQRHEEWERIATDLTEFLRRS